MLSWKDYCYSMWDSRIFQNFFNSPLKLDCLKFNRSAWFGCTEEIIPLFSLLDSVWVSVLCEYDEFLYKCEVSTWNKNASWRRRLNTVLESVRATSLPAPLLVYRRGCFTECVYAAWAAAPRGVCKASVRKQQHRFHTIIVYLRPSQASGMLPQQLWLHTKPD